MRLTAVIPLFACASFMWAADPGITADSITLGQCAALTGPAAGLGTGMNHGLNAWIKATNAAGGIHGRQIKLVTADDAYDPDKCVEGTAKLIEEDHVFALTGYVGTPTAKVAIPIASEHKVPLIGAFTGAALLRKDEKTGKPFPYVINFRASYGNETEALIERLTTDLGIKRIACFYQNDSFGLAGLAGTEAALKKRSMELVAKGTFERGTVAVKKGLADIMGGTPEAVIMVGPYKPISVFLKEAKAAGLSARFGTVSFVGTNNLISEAGTDGEGVIISQVVPSPQDNGVPLVHDYQAAFKAAYPDEHTGYVSLEGYATGRMLGLGLEKAGADLTRAGLLSALEGLAKQDLGGMTLTFGADDHQGSDQVFITQISNGEAKPVAALSK